MGGAERKSLAVNNSEFRLSSTRQLSEKMHPPRDYEGDDGCRGGFLQFPKKAKYFPVISADQGGNEYDTNVQKPVQLKLKGNVENSHDPKGAFHKCEVPHGGIWVQRKTSIEFNKRSQNVSPRSNNEKGVDK